MGFAHRYPELYQLLFERPVPGFVPSEAGMVEANRLIEISAQAMARSIEAGVITTDLRAGQATNLFVALMHGLTALHMSNEPHLPPGEGRFGSLIPAAIRVLQKAWGSAAESDKED
jgi:hypothetical protein